MRQYHPFSESDTPDQEYEHTDLGRVNTFFEDNDEADFRFMCEVPYSQEPEEACKRLFDAQLYNANYKYVYVDLNKKEPKGEKYCVGDGRVYYSDDPELSELRDYRQNYGFVFSKYLPDSDKSSIVPVWYLPRAKDSMLNMVKCFSKTWDNYDYNSLVERSKPLRYVSLVAGERTPCDYLSHLVCDIEISGKTYQIREQGDYEGLLAEMKGGDVVEVLNRYGPSEAFYSQYRAYHSSVDPVVYNQMLQVDAIYRNMKIKYEQTKVGWRITPYQLDGMDSLVKEDATNTYQQRMTLRSDKLVAFPLYIDFNSEDACEEEDCDRVIFYRANSEAVLPRLGVMSSGTVGARYVVNYKELFHNMPKETTHQYCSEVVITDKNVMINHSRFKQKSTSESIMPYVRRLRDWAIWNGDAWKVSEEAWHSPLRYFRLNVSNRRQKRVRLIWLIILTLTLLFAVFWEVAAAINNWQMALGIFHSMRVWTFSLIVISTTLLLCYGIYRFNLNQEKWQEYKPNYMTLDEFSQVQMADLNPQNEPGVPSVSSRQAPMVTEL